jgi:hypothetical protein
MNSACARSNRNPSISNSKEACSPYNKVQLSNKLITPPKLTAISSLIDYRQTEGNILSLSISTFEKAVPKYLPFYVKNIYLLDIISPHPMVSPLSYLGP